MWGLGAHPAHRGLSGTEGGGKRNSPIFPAWLLSWDMSFSPAFRLGLTPSAPWLWGPRTGTELSPPLPGSAA